MVNNCTVGRQTRARIWASLPLFGGRPCTGGFTESKWCNADCDCIKEITEGGGEVVEEIIDALCQI